jgi:hypothetical protein
VTVITNDFRSSIILLAHDILGFAFCLKCPKPPWRIVATKKREREFSHINKLYIKTAHLHAEANKLDKSQIFPAPYIIICMKTQHRRSSKLRMLRNSTFRPITLTNLCITCGGMHSNETFTCFNGPCRLLHCQISFWFSHQSHFVDAFQIHHHILQLIVSHHEFLCGKQQIRNLSRLSHSIFADELHHKRNFGRSTINILNAAVLGESINSKHTKRSLQGKAINSPFFTTALLGFLRQKTQKSIAS